MRGALRIAEVIADAGLRDRRRRGAEDDRQRHPVHRSELRLPDRVLASATESIRAAHVEARSAPDGVGLVQADGPALRLHRLLRGAGQERRRLRADPRGAVRARRRARLPRASAPHACRTRGHAVVVVRRGRRAGASGRASRSQRRVGQRAAGRHRQRFLQQRITEHFAAAGHGAQPQVHRPELRHPQRAGQPVRQRLLHPAGARRRARRDGRADRDGGRPLARPLRARPDPAGDQPPQPVDPDGDLWLSVLEATGQPRASGRSRSRGPSRPHPDSHAGGSAAAPHAAVTAGPDPPRPARPPPRGCGFRHPGRRVDPRADAGRPAVGAAVAAGKVTGSSIPPRERP